MSGRSRVLVETAVSVLALGLVLWLAHPVAIWDTLKGTRLSWFLPALAVTIATVPLMAWRWRLLLLAKGLPAPIGWLTRTYFVALFAGQFLPAAIGGDAVRAVELGRRSSDAPEAVASVLIDRLIGLVALVALALLAFAAAGGHRVGGPEVAVAETLFGLCALGALGLLFSSRLRGLAARALEPRAQGRRLAAGQQFYDALHSYRGHRATLTAVGGLALVVQAIRIGTICMLVKALQLHVSVEEVFVVGPVLFAALVLPVSLNGIGVREAVFVYFLRDSTTPAQGAALGVAFFLLGSATALVGALVLAWRLVRYGAKAVRPRTEIGGEPPGSGPAAHPPAG